MHNQPKPRVTIIMPTFKQAAFIRRAIESVCAQLYTQWELWIIDDSSPDETFAIVQPYVSESGRNHIYYHRFETNRGMGAAINYGMEHAQGSYIAYLPSDDYYYKEHLAGLVQALDADPQSIAAYSGIRYHNNRMAEQMVPGFALQAVQVLHRLTPDRWVERSELVTDDLERMFWHKLRPKGAFHSVPQVTCEWVDHPHQRYKILREPVGGLNTYRQYYRVQEPIRIKTNYGNYMDEDLHYQRFRQRPDTPMAPDGLKILMVGELAYNPERVLALEELGHKLYGLWMPEPYWYNTVGPLPFGHVEDIPAQNWKEAVREIRPDVIYALLNWQAVPFANQVMKENPGIPFVWHFKEGPFICLEKGTWDQMVELTLCSDGQIYSSPEMRDWYETAVPGSVSQGFSFVLDGDLPKKEWLNGERLPLLSEQDGEIHTVVPGRPIGLHPYNVVELAEVGIHLHFYGDFTHGQWLEWIEKTKRLAPDHIHLHSQVDQEGWVKEFSQYDAGWLHYFESANGGDIRNATWDDMNYPARIATYVTAGLPMLQYDNSGHIVAMQEVARKHDIGLYLKNMQDLHRQISDKSRMAKLRENVWKVRKQFTFDYHAEGLVQFFRQVIDNKSGKHARGRLRSKE